MLKATAGYSRMAERDVALLLTLYGTAMATTELAKITWATTWSRTAPSKSTVRFGTILGHKSVTTTKRLVEGDPARLADIVAGAV